MSDIKFVGTYRIEGEGDLSDWCWAWVDPSGDMVFEYDYRGRPERYLPAWEELPLEHWSEDVAELFSLERRIRSVRNSIGQATFGEVSNDIGGEFFREMSKLLVERNAKAAKIAKQVRERQGSPMRPTTSDIGGLSVGDVIAPERAETPAFAPNMFGVFASGILRDAVPKISLSVALKHKNSELAELRSDYGQKAGS